MKTLALLSVCLTSVSAQGFLNGLSNLLTSAVGGGPVGEVEGYENAPYQVVNSYDVSLLSVVLTLTGTVSGVRGEVLPQQHVGLHQDWRVYEPLQIHFRRQR